MVKIININKSKRTTKAVESKDKRIQFPANFPDGLLAADKYDEIMLTTNCVLEGSRFSAIISGPAGLGKTAVVTHQLQCVGWTEDVEFIIVKGFMTAAKLFETLEENNGKLIVFDDCDSVLQDNVAKSLLMSALDDKAVRKVTYGIKRKDDKIMSIEFTGRIIFITNLERLKKHAEALASRSLVCTLDLTTLEICDYIEKIITKVPYGKSTLKDRRKVLSLLKSAAITSDTRLDFRQYKGLLDYFRMRPERIEQKIAREFPERLTETSIMSSVEIVMTKEQKKFSQDGKVLKGEYWQSPKLGPIIVEQSNAE